ncbi:isocitrate lyase/phosphoenolpyruvate mutase family protein (plasmid) [Agrobacterium vitis]|uniref:isocitrate lyase/phosphoenolpyruvate mutase family protein n=1 Tax=Agrobacterium vitis TaxID=373 RepID=UPI003D29E7ED
MTLLSHHILPEERQPKLKALLGRGRPLRFMETHNPLSAIVAQTASAVTLNGETARFDGLWLSGFSMATSRGLPDIELARFERRLETIEEIAAATDLPLIADGDTGGESLAFQLLCARLETIGVSAVVIEDKVFPKRTSLADGVRHALEDPHLFVSKIANAKSSLKSTDFMIIARTEALIAGAGIEEALRRAEVYLESAADGILVHSKVNSGKDVFEFATNYRRLCSAKGIRKPLVVIPTAYPQFYERDLAEVGIDLVIYGNHQIRAAHAAMTNVCQLILQHERALEAQDSISTVRELIDAVGSGE